MKTKKNLKFKLAVAFVGFTMLFASCAPITGGKDGNEATGLGKIRIDLPMISARLASALAAGSGSARNVSSQRAFFFCSRAELELRDGTGRIVDSWEAFPEPGMPSTANPEDLRSIPTGGPYTIHARIFNNAVSESEPVVAGSSSPFSISDGEEIPVTIRCIPNETFVVPLVAGTPFAGTLPSFVLGADGTLSSTGAEAWFRIIPGAGTNRVDLSLDYASATAYMALFRSDGAWTGGEGIGSDPIIIGGNLSFGVPVIPEATYYAGIVFSDSVATPDRPFTLRLTESTSGSNLITNGDFSDGTNGWELMLSGSASASISVVPNDGNPELKLAITDGGTPFYDLHFVRMDLALETGKSYRLEFRARASTGPLELGSGIAAQDAMNPHVYSQQSFEIEESSRGKYYGLDIYIDGPTTNEGIFFFQIQDADVHDVDFYFDDISLTEVVPIFPAPSVVAVASGRNVHLSWDEVPDAVEYLVYRRCVDPGGNSWQGPGNFATNSFDDQNLPYGGTYEYRVQATSPAGDGAFGFAAVTVAGKPVSGTIADTGLTGDYTLVVQTLLNGFHKMTDLVTLDLSGACTFAINGGEQLAASRPNLFHAWLDVSDGAMASYELNTGDYICTADSYLYDEGLDDGTITGMNFSGASAWSVVGSIPIFAEAWRGTDATYLEWWDLEGRGAGGVLVERSVDSGAWVPVVLTQTYGWEGDLSRTRYSQRGGHDEGAVAGHSYRYRIGPDLNSSGSLDAGEYAETRMVGEGTINVVFE